MAQKALLPIDARASRKRVLIVASTCMDADMRSAYLRTRGYDVDCVASANVALRLSRVHSYDLILLAVDPDFPSLTELARELEQIRPTSTIACLADCKKPIPPLPCHRMLWKGEPLEYFVARVEALASA
jgi:PleD family two-component response regulator